MIILNIIILIFLFWLLAIVCDVVFVPSLEKIAQRLNMSAEFAGATLMAVGSSAPELFTAIFALTKGTENISVGAWTIVGSALFNILVIIWASALIAKVKLSWKPVTRDLWFYIISILVLLWAFWDGQIVMLEVIIFVVLYIIYIYIAKNRSKWLNYTDSIDVEEIEEDLTWVSKLANKLFTGWIPNIKSKPFIIFLVSIAVIWVATHFMVDSGIFLAKAIGMSPALIGLTVLAIGTSVPDLISSVLVAKNGKWDMAVANGIGSNIFDILFGLWLPYLLYFGFTRVQTIPVDNNNLMASIILLFASVVAVLFVLITKKWKLGKTSWLFLILLYVGYLIWQIIVSL